MELKDRGPQERSSGRIFIYLTYTSAAAPVPVTKGIILELLFRSVAKIHLGQLEYFELGNLDSLRDWGHAKVGSKMFLAYISPAPGPFLDFFR